MKKVFLNGVEHIVSIFLDGFVIKETPSSSNVQLIAVNADKAELFVRFKNGGQYFYSPVDPLLLHQILTAESAGKFVSSQIAGKFPSTKISNVVFTPVVAKNVIENLKETFEN